MPRHVRPYPPLSPVPHRPGPEIHPFQAAECSLHQRQVLVRPHRLLWRELPVVYRSPDHVHPIQRRLLADPLLVPPVAEPFLRDLKQEVLAHLVAVHHLPHRNADLVFAAQRTLRALCP